jgi:spore germination protein YaaH
MCVVFFVIKFSWGNVTWDADSQLSFREIWGYLMRGEEKYFRKEAPITDIFYFSAGVNTKGRINTSVNPPFTPVFSGGDRRIHLVISDLTNTSLMHFCLNKKNAARRNLIRDIVEVSYKFDGIQIDFEAVDKSDKYLFLGFLRDLKKSLPGRKILSVAVPPRRTYIDDAYDYSAISRIADRILVMAYDQHWSTSRPGPVASLSWCREVALFALKNIPRSKLIMGLPLYGREWDDQGFSRSLKWNQVNALMERDDAVIEYSVDQGFKVMYDQNMKVTLYYDDIKATKHKLVLYRNHRVGVGFWRLGMENANLWEILRIAEGG